MKIAKWRKRTPIKWYICSLFTTHQPRATRQSKVCTDDFLKWADAISSFSFLLHCFVHSFSIVCVCVCVCYACAILRNFIAICIICLFPFRNSCHQYYCDLCMVGSVCSEKCRYFLATLFLHHIKAVFTFSFYWFLKVLWIDNSSQCPLAPHCLAGGRAVTGFRGGWKGVVAF